MTVASPIQWRVVEDALYDWVASSTGVETIWANHEGPQPSYPYATLNVLTGPAKLGARDDIRLAYNTTTSQLEAETTGLREILVTCQMNAGPTTTPETHAMNLMSRAQSALSLDEFCERLGTAGLAVVQEQPINDVTLFVGNERNSRAQMDVRFMLAASIVDDDAGYFDKVTYSTSYTNAPSALDTTDEQIGPP